MLIRPQWIAGWLLASAALCSAAAPNKAPTVAITSPTTGSTFTAPATITIGANASDSDGSITKVDFYQGAMLIGSRSTPPYTLTWSNVAGGAYSLTAQAVDNGGASKTSTPVSITVNGAKVLVSSPPAGAMVYGNSVTVTGSFFGDSGATVLVDNGNTTRLATLNANTYSATLPLYVGANNLRVTVTRQDRTSDQAIIGVTGNDNPVLVFTSPSTTVFDAPANVPLVVDALSPAGSIGRVEFLRNGSLLGSATAPPYAYTWFNVAAGDYVITARATDANGVASVAYLSMTVNGGNILPDVALTSPLAGATFTAPASIALLATASDPDGSVTRVDFLQNNSVIGTTNVAPYAMTWSGVPSGSYALTAKATDNRGGVKTSSPTTVTVQASNAPPSASLTSPIAGAVYSAPATIVLSAAASDSDGTIAKVDFYQGSNLLGTATAAPYTLSWPNVAAGAYNLTARATDNAGAATTSSPVNVTVNANNAPSVALTSPAAGSAYFAPATVSLAATASDTDGTITKVDFYQGSTILGTATTSPYAFTWSNAPAGTYVLTSRATDNGGAIATSAPVTITISANAPPSVTLTSPNAGTTYIAPATIAVAAAASDSDGTISRVEFYQGTTLIGTATAAPYAVTWSNVPVGNYVVTAKAVDNAGAAATSSPLSVTVGAVNVTIQAPSDGATVASDIVNVAGTINAPVTSGVTVNGVVAGIDATGHFYANGVPLTPGSNTVTATLTTLEGQTATARIGVNSTGPNPVRITATPTYGISPLAARFSIIAQDGIAIQATTYTFAGNGDVAWAIDPTDSAVVTFTGAGTVTNTVATTDTHGNSYAETFTIVVIDRSQADQALRAVWTGMTASLAAGDKARAMTYLNATAKAKYGPVFDALAPVLGQTVASFSAPQLSAIADGFGEYAVNRMINGVNRIYFIYFIQGDDGVWRIDSM